MIDRAKAHRILVVEDEAVIRRLLGRALAAAPYTLDTAESVLDAYDRMDAAAYHLLITDLRLPDGDGLDVIHRFRARFPTSQVIVITGSLEPDALLKGISLDGLAGCLVKPFELAEIASIIDEALGRAPLLKPAA